MFIEIQPNHPKPIYEQLISQIKKAIVKGELAQGEMLPSVRVLAGDLGVNMHTINKSYNLLVEEGILVKSQRGYMIEIAKDNPLDFEDQLQEKIEALLIDIYIHDLPPEKIKGWTREIAEKLRREW